MAVTVLLARWLLPVADEPARPAVVAVVYATATLFALTLFRHGREVSLFVTVRWCFTAAVALTLALVLDPFVQLPALQAANLAVLLFLCGMTVSVASRGWPMPIVLTVLALLVLLPVWAAPAVEHAGNPRGLTNAVVALSPLTSFALALDLDYLRTSWFYSNVALGSMRYEYPSLGTVYLVLFLVPAAVLMTRQLRQLGIPLNRHIKEAHP